MSSVPSAEEIFLKDTNDCKEFLVKIFGGSKKDWKRTSKLNISTSETKRIFENKVMQKNYEIITSSKDDKLISYGEECLNSVNTKSNNKYSYELISAGESGESYDEPIGLKENEDYITFMFGIADHDGCFTGEDQNTDYCTFFRKELEKQNFFKKRADCEAENLFSIFVDKSTTDKNNMIKEFHKFMKQCGAEPIYSYQIVDAEDEEDDNSICCVFGERLDDGSFVEEENYDEFDNFFNNRLSKQKFFSSFSHEMENTFSFYFDGKKTKKFFAEKEFFKFMKGCRDITD